ncbi:DNA-3-methyladenine glycosylase family protein [Blastochloris viridis]|nr:DNA-3-methyladenine glycosylase [Blastochloris viridis]BAR98663.1 DNA-3-methyladenine glycosylase II [Blastochloris viridis]
MDLLSTPGPDRLDTEADLAHHLAELVAGDSRLAALLGAVGTVPLRRHPPGFSSLVGIMVGQQLSTASAAAILGRLRDKLDPLTPARALGADAALLRACGLSAAKMRTLAAMAEAVESGRVPLDALAELPADEARAILCTVPGIGPWTADLYLLFALGNPDAFPSGDLALQEAARLGFGLPTRPSARALAEIAEAWRPRRGVAAKLLWAYYRFDKRREGVPA